MGKKEPVIRLLKRFRTEASKHIAIDKMILFGSRVWGKPHKDSDIDLIIVSKKFRGVKSRKRAIPLYDYWDLDYPVDFLCYTPEEFNRLKNMITLVREAVREGVEI